MFYSRKPRRDTSLAYLVVGIVIGLFVMGVVWSVSGAEEIEPPDETATQTTAATVQTPVQMPVIDNSETNCKMLEEFRDAVTADVDTGALPELSKPYRKVSVEKAKSTAVAWASDAVWIGFSIPYPAEGSAFLNYTYYSASKGANLIISFGLGGASVNSPTTREEPSAVAPTAILNTSVWQVTLADAWATAYAQVRPNCGEWWKETAALGWVTRLRMEDTKLVWEFSFVKMGDNTSTPLTIVIDATSGKVLSKSWDGSVGSNTTTST